MPTTSNIHTERVFEDELCAQMAASGWAIKTHLQDATSYSRELAIFPDDLIDFVKATQPVEWAKFKKWHNGKSDETFVKRVAKQLDTHGMLHVLRHGFKDVDAKFFLCQFRPAHKKNPKLIENLDKNRMTVVRQLHYSLHNENSIDLVLFVNGLPIATSELKTDLTQSVRDAINQYKTARLPKDAKSKEPEALLQFKTRTLVHFAVSTDLVFMASKLAGDATYFLPFNIGKPDGVDAHSAGAGNPPAPAGTRSHLLVFDAGPQYERESDAGQRVVLPLLRSRGEARIDTLVPSHRDRDHVGGAGSMLKALPVDDVLSSLEPAHPLPAVAGHATRCSAGQSWWWDGVRFEVLRPVEADYERSLKSNAMSCVLRIEGGGRSALLTGDFEREQDAALLAAQEAALLAGAAQALRSDVLIVPHHGSRTSSSAAFLDTVRPRSAVIQAGYRKRFHHPAPDVLERYRARGIAVIATPACGAWHWNTRAAPAGICEHDAGRRYRHHQPVDSTSSRRSLA